MKYRKLADCDVSVLGFGCMRFPLLDDDMGNIDEPEATRMLRYAIDNGVNYVDSAWGYHRGNSEIVTGRALLDGYRDKAYLATKLPTWAVKCHDDCDKFLNEQLKRLQTDHIDFYLLHALDESRWARMQDVDCIKFLERAIGDGRIRYAGFSFHDHFESFRNIVDSYNWTFCQIQYNYMDENYQAGTRGLKYAHGKGKNVIGMEPLRGGKLTKKVPDEIREMLDEQGITKTPAELGLRWVWNHSEFSVVLSGMSSMDQVEENLRIADHAEPDSLTETELEIIGQIKELYTERTKIPCTSCRYCLPCPSGVAIPEILNTYNDLHIYRDEAWAKAYYNIGIRSERWADKCVECGQCEDLCPQEIQIIESLKICHKALTE
jgi:predicted aldo/keto reductase-like oxidoreductase